MCNSINCKDIVNRLNDQIKLQLLNREDLYDLDNLNFQLFLEKLRDLKDDKFFKDNRALNNILEVCNKISVDFKKL